MHRIMALTLEALLFCIPSLAVSVTTLQPTLVIRHAGPPEVVSLRFAGRPGLATLHVFNDGAVIRDVASSAQVIFRGIEIVRPDEFKKSAAVISRELSVAQNNDIQVIVYGKPGSYIRISVVQTFSADAGAVLDDSGGTLEVTNAASPIFRSKLVVPAGALSAPTVITMETRAARLSDEYLPAGPPLSLEPNGLQFASPAALHIRFNDTDHDGLIDESGISVNDIRVLTSDNDTDWEFLDVAGVDLSTSTLQTQINHFSVDVPVVGTTLDVGWQMKISDQADWFEDSQVGNDATQLGQFYFSAPLPSVPYPELTLDALGLRLYTVGRRDRVKLRTSEQSRFSSGVTRWYVYVPTPKTNRDVPGELDAVSIGAFLLYGKSCDPDNQQNPDPQRLNCYELDFEIAPFKKAFRSRFFPGIGSDDVLVTMGTTGHFVKVNSRLADVKLASEMGDWVSPGQCDESTKLHCGAYEILKGNRWYLLDLQIKPRAGNESDVTWIIDNVPRVSMRLSFKDKPFAIWSSLEALPDYGAYEPSEPADTYIDFVKHYKVQSQGSDSANLVKNPGFDANLLYWTTLPPSSYGFSASWSEKDAGSSSSSGSVRIVQPYGEDNWPGFGVLSQCVQISGGQTYTFGATVFAPNPLDTINPFFGFLQSWAPVGLVPAVDSNCLSPQFPGPVGPHTSFSGSWVQVLGTWQAPIDARSVQVVLFSYPAKAGTTFNGYVDNVILTRQ